MTKIILEDYLKEKGLNKFDIIVVTCKKAYEIESGRVSLLSDGSKSTILAIQEICSNNNCNYDLSKN